MKKALEALKREAYITSGPHHSGPHNLIGRHLCFVVHTSTFNGLLNRGLIRVGGSRRVTIIDGSGRHTKEYTAYRLDRKVYSRAFNTLKDTPAGA